MNTRATIALKPTAAAPISESSRQARLSNAIDEFYAAIDNGHSVDRAKLLEKYSDIAEELEDCLQNLDFIQQITPQLAAGAASHNDSIANSPRSHLGDFRILREIGRGGMGVVYEAEQLSLGRHVALKVLPFAAMLDKQQLTRFKNEARAAGTLDHPNIVAIHSVGAERGVHYYAMQLIEGRSLAEIIASMKPGRAPSVEDATAALSKPLTAADTAKAALPTVKAGGSAAFSSIPPLDSREYFRVVAQLGIQAAEALDHAHQSGILHRDIKPANLLVDDSGKLWITDFGLARIETDVGITMTGDLLGTLRYMSPEQALAKRVVVDHRSDVYSLGVTLYELLTLQPAYTGGDRQELLRQIAFDEPQAPRRINCHIPQDLDTIVVKAIEKNPADRYATAQELADDLQRFVNNRAIMARVPSIAQRTRRWAQRHVGLLAVTSALFFIVAIGASVSALLVGRERTIAENNARKSDANAKLAVGALEEAVAAFLVGNLDGQKSAEQHRTELLRSGLTFFEDYARQNNVSLSNIPTYQRLVREKLNEEALELQAAGQFDQACQVFEASIAQSEKIVAKYGQPRDEADANCFIDLRVLASCYSNYASVLKDAGNRELSKEYLLKSRDMSETIFQQYPHDERFAYSLGLNHYNLGKLERDLGDRANAEAAFRAAIALLLHPVNEKPINEKWRFLLAMGLYNLSFVLPNSGTTEETEKVWQESLVHWRNLAADYPEVADYHSHAGVLLNNIAGASRDRNELDSARQMFEEAIWFQKRALACKPFHDFVPVFLGRHYNGLASVLRKQGDDAALDALQKERDVTLAPFKKKNNATPESATRDTSTSEAKAQVSSPTPRANAASEVESKKNE